MHLQLLQKPVYEARSLALRLVYFYILLHLFFVVVYVIRCHFLIQVLRTR